MNIIIYSTYLYELRTTLVCCEAAPLVERYEKKNVNKGRRMASMIDAGREGDENARKKSRE